ncbi:diguanylate cyclase [Pantoea sp. Mb-10]|uniref:diguanylate cyclase n=1 Tax=unclassified Pantoea TaxID=2630326 RepID=UPI001E56209A|nr:MULTISPECIES: diguanylate cyclase [unclassified Pantoea]MCE0491068.1 diguanylate cyclase [Pantoea sp. Mb-10]MCE0502557.1 diguanylate cyclase [Pantoea sp. Pb-8]
MNYYSPDVGHLKRRSQRFVRRMFIMRQLGTILCFFPILSVLLEQHRSPFICLLLFINAYFWPWLAHHRALRAEDSTVVERQNLTLDAAFGGIWVALMALSPLPSFVMMAVLASDRYSAGGGSLLLAALKAFFCGFALTWLMDGTKLTLHFSMQTVWLTLPLATCYLLALSVTSYNLTLQLRKRNRELERIALMDPGLQLPNRRLFERHLESEFLCTRRGESAAYLLLMDVDHFKTVNDTWGHEAGDFLLAEISALLRNYVGLQDIPARLGGDELSVIIHHASDESVVILARRLQEKIATVRLPAAQAYRCSVSIGIASASRAESLTQWLRHADEALYDVKRAGRNDVRLWQEQST